MLIFNEGLPRSGKSYDCMKVHVLPALKSGRKCYVRINGLDNRSHRERIAVYLGMEMERLDALLIHVSTKEVSKLFRAVRVVSDENEEWVIPEQLKDALFVVDEAHEFYVSGRDAMDPAIENFFALCGQNGMDGILMSQSFRRLHSSARMRIERKNVFQKLTAVGLQKNYTVKRYHATAPDRFELIATETKTYDPEIFPLYKGYAEGASNITVYTAGGITVWKRILKYSLVMVPLVGLGVYCLSHFFGGHSGIAKRVDIPHAQEVVTAPKPVAKAIEQAKAITSTSLHPTYDIKGMSPEVAYVFALSGEARPRLAGTMTMGDKVDGVIEWMQDGGKVLDRMTIRQLEALGVTVKLSAYGAKLSFEKQAIIITEWPSEMLAASSTRQTVQDDGTGASNGQRGQGTDQGDSGSKGGHYPDRQTSHPYMVPEQSAPGPMIPGYVVSGT